MSSSSLLNLNKMGKKSFPSFQVTQNDKNTQKYANKQKKPRRVHNRFSFKSSKNGPIQLGHTIALQSSWVLPIFVKRCQMGPKSFNNQPNKKARRYKKGQRTLQTPDMIRKSINEILHQSWSFDRSKLYINKHIHLTLIVTALLLHCLTWDWRQPCLLAWSKKVFPFQVRLLQSSETVPAKGLVMKTQ
jgi:hypothetical protein